MSEQNSVQAHEMGGSAMPCDGYSEALPPMSWAGDFVMLLFPALRPSAFTLGYMLSARSRGLIE